jgi:hypothetical protein
MASIHASEVLLSDAHIEALPSGGQTNRIAAVEHKRKIALLRGGQNWPGNCTSLIFRHVKST